MTVLFDGHDLSELVICGDPEITILGSSTACATPSGRDGVVVMGRTWSASTVCFTVTAIGDATRRRDAMSMLGRWLDVSGPRPLVLPDTPDRFYMAVPDKQVKLARFFGGESGKLTFNVVDPAAYGLERAVTVPSGGSATFTVGGTYKTKPRIAANAVRSPSSLVWGLRLDDGDFVHVATGSASARAVAIDCAERTCVVNSSVALPTLDSDWLELEPGEHTLRMDNGTGEATVTFVERWL